MIVSFDFPQVLVVKDLSTFNDFLAFSVVCLMCSAKFSLGSRIRPRTLGFLTVGIGVLFIVSVNCVLYSAGSGVKSVAVDLSGFRISSFAVVHSCKSSR